MRLFCVFLLVISCVLAACAADTPTASIKLDQAGYLPSGQKIALVTAAAGEFVVKRAGDGAIVLRGKLSSPAADADTGDRVQAADFSQLRDSGSYYIEIPGVGRSWTFSISPDVYVRPYYLAMRAFYGQRCGIAIDLGPEFPGYTHPACHAEGAFHQSSGNKGTLPNVGGWHDAGDYGRYMPTSGITTGTLLWAWEMFPERVKKIGLKIPESGNGTPDILNEARWNLTWMLQMQDDDSGVFHKQTSEHFSGFVMPEQDQLPSVVIGTGAAPYKSTCATADLAAVAAIAARVYGPFDAKFAARNLSAARRAWIWTEQNPNVVFKNPSGVSTGEYGDSKCGDERLWAAAELWRTTGEAAYHRYFLENYTAYLPTLASPSNESWAQLAPMGLWTYVLANRKDADPRTVAAIRDAAVAAAQNIVARTQRSPYRVSMLPQDYVWGSNGVAMNYGMQLLVTNALSPSKAFVEAAGDNLHYVFGRNAFSLSWVTQVGSNYVRNPHHRPSGADKNVEPWPGLLSGGPNAGRQDDVLKRLPAALPPAKVYSDDQDSYASNEIAINWQAMLVFVLAGQLP